MNKILPPIIGILLILYGLIGCSSEKSIQIQIYNPIKLDREYEIIEIPIRTLKTLSLKENERFVVFDSEQRQVDYQLTYDSLLIFPVSVKAKSGSEYIIKKGIPDSVQTFACGKHYPRRMDDIAWENDKAAYRTYGPALQANGEKAYGYDIFTKSVPEPVVEQRYEIALDTVVEHEIRWLIANGYPEKADSLSNAISYHVDHGNGMDCYSVGPTLGGGTAALMVDSTIIYPYCYQNYKILNNGPLRFTVKLTYAPLTVKNDSDIIEIRVITLDKGSYLNRTEVVYKNLSEETFVVSGIVIHPQNPNGFYFSSKERYIAYADSTDCTDCDNGIIYLGVAFPPSLKDAYVQWFPETEKPFRSGALGHVLGINTYTPNTTYTYYWGSGWSKGDVSGIEVWKEYLKEYAAKIAAPLKIKITKFI